MAVRVQVPPSAPIIKRLPEGSLFVFQSLYAGGHDRRFNRPTIRRLRPLNWLRSAEMQLRTRWAPPLATSWADFWPILYHFALSRGIDLPE